MMSDSKNVSSCLFYDDASPTLQIPVILKKIGFTNRYKILLLKGLYFICLKIAEVEYAQYDSYFNVCFYLMIAQTQAIRCTIFTLWYWL